MNGKVLKYKTREGDKVIGEIFEVYRCPCEEYKKEDKYIWMGKEVEESEYYEKEKDFWNSIHQETILSRMEQIELKKLKK
jgi:hypothetical protein